MNITTSNKVFLSTASLLAVGILSGCQYCEPLLLATLVTGAIYKGVTYLPFTVSQH